MSKPCNIKTVSEAWNHAIKACANGLRLSNNNPTKAITYTLNELREKYPDIKFDEDSVVNPLVEKLKEKGLADKNYQYRKQKLTNIEKAFNKFKDLSDLEKKKLTEAVSKSKEITPQSIKNEYAELKGYPNLTPEFNKLVEQTATDRQAYEKVDREQKAALGEIQSLKKEGKYTLEKEKEFKAKNKELNEQKKEALKNYLKSDLAFGEHLSKAKYWEMQIGDMAKMNLMSALTLLKNNTGMAADWTFRTASKLLSSPIELAVIGARRAMGKSNANIESVALYSHISGAFKGNARNKGALTFMSGSEATYSDKVRTPNYIDGARNIRNIMNGEPKFKNLLAFALKLSPTIVTRGLSSPDAMVTEMAEKAELNRLGNIKGYKGAELQAFINAPDEKSAEQSKEYGKMVTYKKDMPFSEYIKINMDFSKIGQQMIEKGGNPFLVRLGTATAHMVKNRISPFFTTPINLLRTANRIVLPEYNLAKGLYQASKMEGDEKILKITNTVAEAAVGMHVRMVALSLISQGLMTGGHDDEEDKTGEIIEKKAGGFNRINVNAAMRGLMFQDIKEEKGDVYADINSMGAMGIAFGSYQHAYGKLSKDDLQKQTDYLKNWNAASVPFNAAMSEMSASLDYTFMTGWNDAFKMFKGKGADREKWMQESVMFMIGSVLPAQHQIFSKSTTESRPKMYDKDLTFSENVYNTMGYKFFFQAPNKSYKVLTDTQSGEKPERIKEKLWFDNYWGRVLASTDPFKTEVVHNPSTPAEKLYNAMRSVPKEDRDNIVPSYVSDKVQIKGNDVVLNKEQYNYFQSQASLYRMANATPYIMSTDFDTHDYKFNCDVLKTAYEKGRTKALLDVQKTYFPNIKRIKNTEDRQLKKVKRKYFKD